jgi:hypothetical protein
MTAIKSIKDGTQTIEELLQDITKLTEVEVYII